MNTFRQRSAGNRTGWLSLFAGAGKGLLALLLFSFSFAARANDNPFFASKDYFHWADKTSTWDNGNLSKNKSAYKEGDVVPHSYVPENLTNGQSYSILLKYDYLLSTKNAGGFVALVWDPTLFSVTPTGQMGEGSLSNGNKSLPSIGSYYATNLSITNVVAKPDETSGNTTLKVWEITFTYTGINGSDAALYFGLRLAQVGEVATNGAAAWSGASLQTYLDPSSDPGTRSLQIDPGAIQSACPNPPTVDAGTYGPLCANGDAINLNQGTPAGGTWSGTGVSGDQTNGYTFDPSVGTQILTYTYTDGNGCSNSDETTITVNNPPNVSVGTYGPLCSNGDDIALGGIPNGGTWTGTGVSGSQATGYTFDPSAGTQTLTYSYTDPNTGCTASATVIITVNEPPVVTAGTYGPLCANASPINLVGSPAGGIWSGTGVSGDQTNGYTFDPSVGTQTLTYTYTDGNGCSNSDETTITVNNPPNVSVGTYGPLCSNGDDIALGGIPNGGTWTGTGVSGSQATGYTFDPSAGTQTLTYSYTDPNTGCTASATVIITVNEPPVVTAGTYGPLCANASPINLVGSPAGGIWSGTGVSGDQTNGYTFDPSVGTQTLTYTYTAGGCSNSDQATVVVNPVATVDAGLPQTICSNGTATLAGSFGGSATSATWSSAGDGKFDDATKLNAVYTPGAQDIANGSVVLTLTTNDPDGPCDAATATVTITIEKAPTADFTYSQSCTGGIAKISLTGTVTNSVSQTWTTDGDGTFDDASKLNAVYTPGQLDRGKGSVNITLTANVAEGSACAPASKTYTVAVTPCGPYYTYTQGYYGNSGGMACTPTGSKTTLQLIQQSLDNMSGAPNDQAGTLYLGKAGASFSMTYADASKLILIMPGGGPANKLAGNYSLTSTATYPPLKNGKINNVLLSQTITLALNVAIPGNDLGGLILQDGYLTTITRSSSSCTAPAATCPNGIVSSKKITLNPALMALLNGKTVTDLLNLASAALGGTLPAGVSYSDISNAVDVINNLFDAGRYSLGYFDCAKTCSTLTQPCTVMIVSNRQSSDAAEVETVAGKLAVSAYPNPFTDRVRFTIQSPKAGRATLEVYNMLGQKLAVPFEGQLNAGETRNVDYTAPVNHRSSLIYLLRMNGEQASGKLMSTKQ